ncbi:hypothetical protein L218DRAFT_628445 [Marasmius fiardii PR-910]|nr:hypothetical protein L218DRAFT_628445 [Marasmius fiardii PR-910]
MTRIGIRSPDIPQHAAEVWAKVLGNHLPGWWDWTTLMTSIVFSLTSFQSDRSSEGYGVSGSGVCEGNNQMGIAFLSHLDYQTQRFSDMTLDEMRVFNGSLVLMESATFKNQSPLYLESVREHSLPAVIRILSCVLRGRPNGAEFAECVFGIISISLNHLFELMNDYHWVAEALQHGVLKVILNVNPFLFQCESLLGTRIGALSDRLVALLQRVSTFLLYRSVLHQFSIASQKIEKSGKLESRMKASSGTVWMQAKDSASKLLSARRLGKAEGSLNLCGSEQCPRRDPEAVDEPAPNVRYFACAACSSVMYCSSTCQTYDWNHGHRESCPTIVKSRPVLGPFYNSISIPMFDRIFFQFWITNYITENRGPSPTANATLRLTLKSGPSAPTNEGF